MKRRYFLVGAALAAIAAAVFAYFLPQLPAQVPIHWDIHGRPDGHGSRWMLLAVGPGLMLAMLGLFALLPRLSPKRFEMESFERTWLDLMLIVVLLLGYFFAVAMWSSLSPPADRSRALVAGLCLAAILIGNLLGKVRRNFFIGIRTPWTLASERIWYDTHRNAARVAVVAGIVALAGVILGAPTWTSVAIVIAGFTWPVLYSLILFLRQRDAGS
jgi:uncharacterized membrane protein